MQAAEGVAQPAVSMALKELLPGKFSGPMYTTELKRWLRLFKLRAGPGEKKLAATGLLKPLRHSS